MLGSILLLGVVRVSALERALVVLEPIVCGRGNGLSARQMYEQPSYMCLYDFREPLDFVAVDPARDGGIYSMLRITGLPSHHLEHRAKVPASSNGRVPRDCSMHTFLLTAIDKTPH